MNNVSNNYNKILISTVKNSCVCVCVMLLSVSFGGGNYYCYTSRTVISYFLLSVKNNK